VRVSTEGQATEGVSLDAQQAKIQAWCLANDAELGNNKGVRNRFSLQLAYSVPDTFVSGQTRNSCLAVAVNATFRQRGLASKPTPALRLEVLNEW
jgi:hypothetical protein